MICRDHGNDVPGGDLERVVRRTPRIAPSTFVVGDLPDAPAEVGDDPAPVAIGGEPGWSQGVAAHWASRNPGRAVGAVLVDGAYPYDWLDEAMEQRIRKMFRLMGLFLPLLRPTGLTARMSATQQADSNIELGRISRARELGPVLDDITVPVRYVVASGTSLGSKGDEQERIRTSLVGVTARNPHIRISAKVASNHGALLRKDSHVIAGAVREVAALDQRR